jgi:hypothetical protein
MSLPNLPSWPCWGPETISQSYGFDSELRAAAVIADVDQEFITDLQNALGVGASVWNNPYLENNAAAIKAPRFSHGALHYMTGWLASEKYFQCIERWHTADPFFANLYRLIEVIRKLPEFRVAVAAPRKLYAQRVMDDHAYIKRGQIPFIELAFRCWKSNAPANLHQMILYTAFENYTFYVRSQKRSFFDEGIIELLQQIRNAVNPEPNSTGKWEFLKIILDKMPLLDNPYDVKKYLLAQCYNPTPLKPADMNSNAIYRNLALIYAHAFSLEQKPQFSQTKTGRNFLNGSDLRTQMKNHSRMTSHQKNQLSQMIRQLIKRARNEKGLRTAIRNPHLTMNLHSLIPI